VSAGATGSFAGSFTTQWLNTISGNQCSIDTTQLVQTTLIGALLGKFGSVTVDVLTAGNNNFDAIFKQMTTKLQNGTISDVSFLTGLKMFLGRATSTGFFGSVPAASSISAVDRAAKP
jgi:hypothetical protein